MAEETPKYKSVPPENIPKLPPLNLPERGFDSAQNQPKYKSTPPNRPAQSEGSQIKQGIGSRAVNALRNRKTGSSNGFSTNRTGRVSGGGESEAPSSGFFSGGKAGMAKKALSASKTELIGTAVRLGGERAFYVLMGAILPTYGLAIVGLNILLLISLFSDTGKSLLKVWQKLVIVGINLLIIGVFLVILVAATAYFCNAYVLSSKIVSGIGYVTGNEYVAFCKNLNFGDVGFGAGTGSAGSATQAGGQVASPP